MRSSSLTLLMIVVAMFILTANASPIPAPVPGSDILPMATCNMRCSSEYHPVCARNKKSGDTKTFINQCYLDTHNCSVPYDEYEFLHDGKCT
ncbi:hypothetical protein BGZ97_005766 [Linnemannia gamsii]|uniref:Kazal-like domain-containing protein n=1 Tax=Linnemannia gamsii TaxID=64522 RepID=A0A9P6QSI6_9FUNG|nr:hypothetical protein BGZ97_005766 [Linnemannia gamsii]